jgi:hemolysin III
MPHIEQRSAAGERLLLAGGIVYTLGAVFFLLSTRVRFVHIVWQLFVVAGSGLNFAAALLRS